MKLKYSIVLFAILAVGCNRPGTVTRALHYVDLAKNENKSFHEFPREFSTFILDAVMKKKLDAYQIDYFNNGSINAMSDSTLLFLLQDNFYEYGDIDRSSAISYFSLISLISLDEIKLEADYQYTNFINFYFPAEETPEGFNKYICSVSYKDAMKYLRNLDPPVVWNSYKNIDWGWVNNEVFRLDYITSSNLAKELLKNSLVNNSLEYSGELDSSDISGYINSRSDLLFATGINSNSKKGYIYFSSDSATTQLAGYTHEDVFSLRTDYADIQKNWIMPLDQAFESKKFYQEINEQVISSNGVFAPPLSGEDKLSKKPGKKTNTNHAGYKIDQKFYFRSIERINNNPVIKELAPIIYRGVRDGEIRVYENDSLENRIPSGKFFDAMLVEDSKKSILMKPEELTGSMFVSDIYFNLEGVVEKVVPRGISLAIPGKKVPEGFDRNVGFFKTEDIDRLLSNKGHQAIKYQDIHGLPLSLWSIEVINQ